MSNSIKLSKQHGLNPTLPVCFFCGEDKNEIALLGHIGDYRKGEDIEAPRRMVLDYEPCDKCKEHMKQGVTLIEVSDRQPADGRPALKAQGNQEVYPLGGWCVIKAEAFSEMTGQDFSAGDKCFVDSQTLHHITGNNSEN